MLASSMLLHEMLMTDNETFVNYKDYRSLNREKFISKR